jgi:hypothetical protein
MQSAFERAARKYKVSGKVAKGPKVKKSPVLSGMPKPLNVTLTLDTSQLDEALQKLGKAMAHSGKTVKILADAISHSILTGTSAAIQFNGQLTAVDAFMRFEQRWFMLQHLGWTQALEGGLTSPDKSDTIEVSILDNEKQFMFFYNDYLRTGKVPEWIPRVVKVEVEKIALPFDTVRKLLEGRISE